MSRSYWAALAILCILIISFSACSSTQGGKNFWKSTKGYYNKYFNTPASLELDNLDDFDSDELAMGAVIARVDYDISKLLRAMDDSDRGPDNAWAESMFKEFPWLAGIAIVDAKGEPLAKIPEFSLKDFDANPLLEEDPKQNRTALRSYVQNNPLGAEIYLAKPIYLEDEQQALVVVHFDIRALLAMISIPEILTISTPDMLLWPGIFDVEKTPIPETDWPKIVASDVSGYVSNDTGKFYWTSRYFANQAFIYAIPVEGDFPTKPEQLEILGQASAFAIPSDTSEEPVEQTDIREESNSYEDDDMF